MSGMMKRILVILSLVLIVSIASFSLGIAYRAGIRGMGLVSVMFFLTFGVIVVLGQLIPAGILFSSFVRAVTSQGRRSEAPIVVVA